eukprot:gene48833-56677_t
MSCSGLHVTMAECWDRAQPQQPRKPPASCVAVYLGGNDWHSFRKGGAKGDAFVARTAEWLCRVRRARPAAPIVVLCADDCSLASTDSLDEKREAHKVSPSPAIRHSDDADWAAMQHWSGPAHAKWARGAADAIRRHT